jgi:hypothetical protein
MRSSIIGRHGGMFEGMCSGKVEIARGNDVLMRRSPRTMAGNENYGMLRQHL